MIHSLVLKVDISKMLEEAVRPVCEILQLQIKARNIYIYSKTESLIIKLQCMLLDSFLLN